jgi:hypothetical protein
MEKIRIRDNHPGSATLLLGYPVGLAGSGRIPDSEPMTHLKIHVQSGFETHCKKLWNSVLILYLRTIGDKVAHKYYGKRCFVDL